MEFSRDLRGPVLSGAVTVSFRLWRRPKVKVGGRYPVGPGWIEVDSVELVPFSAISAADIRRSGDQDRESLRRRAAHAGPIDDDTLLHRVEFHLVDRGLVDRGLVDRGLVDRGLVDRGLSGQPGAARQAVPRATSQ